MSASTRDVVLSVEGLKTWFHSRDGVAKSVDGVTFDLPAAKPWPSWASPVPASP